jgi:hypothetical protein
VISQKLKFEIIPIYKEFLKFLRQNDFEKIKKEYFDKYKDYFEIFCTRWKMLKEEEIEERIKRAKISHYSNVIDFDINFYPEIEKYLRIIGKNVFEEIFCKIIFYIGFFCPDGKTILRDDEILIGISIDRINDIRDLPIILAHEIGHAQRRKFLKDVKDFFEEIFLSEGIAFYFSHLCFKEIKIYKNLFIKRGNYSYLIKNIKEILKDLKEIDGEILNFLSFFYIKYLVEKLKMDFKEIIKLEKMPVKLEEFLKNFTDTQF